MNGVLPLYAITLQDKDDSPGILTERRPTRVEEFMPQTLSDDYVREHVDLSSEK